MLNENENKIDLKASEDITIPPFIIQNLATDRNTITNNGKSEEIGYCEKKNFQ